MLVAPASKNSTTASPFIQKPSRHGLPELFIWEQPCYETQVRKIQKRMDRENETGSKVKADWACHYFPTSPPLHVTSGTNHAFILKNHFPFLQIFTIFSGQLGWSLVQSFVELFLQFQHWGNESKLCVWWCPCVNYPIRKRASALKATPLELSNLELSWIILNYLELSNQEKSSTLKATPLELSRAVSPRVIRFPTYSTSGQKQIWTNQEYEVIFISHGNLVFSIRLIIHLERSASE